MQIFSHMPNIPSDLAVGWRFKHFVSLYFSFDPFSSGDPGTKGQNNYYERYTFYDLHDTPRVGFDVTSKILIVDREQAYEASPANRV